MQSPSFPLNENKRQRALRSYRLLDTPPEIDYDNITQLASYICKTPISLISLLDGERNWFKSTVGVPFTESPRSLSFCGHAIHKPEEVMIVEDARLDKRFYDNPLVEEMKAAIFYLGVPIKSEEGLPLGTLCVFDDKPRRLEDEQITAMKALAKQVESHIKSRKHTIELQNTHRKLEKTNNLLSDFAAVASHDIKLPIASIVTTADILKTKYKSVLDEDGLNRLSLIKECSFTINEYISGMLEMYTSDKGLSDDFELINLKQLLESVQKINMCEDKCQFWLPSETHVLNSNKIALTQIFTNLFTNAVKYNDKNSCIVNVNFSEDASHYKFTVTDNGPGIPEEHLGNIFKLFKTALPKDNTGKKGNGIGLSIVKKLIRKLNGRIYVSSELGKSTTFTFTIGKPTTFSN